MAYWAVGDNNSGARENQKSVTILTGTAIAGLTVTYANQLVVSSDTSAGFTANTLYMRNAANNAWISIEVKHDHSADTDPAGGLFSNVLMPNTGLHVDLNVPSPRTTDFFNTNTGGTVADDIAANQWRVKLDTGTTANNFRQEDRGSIKLDFGSKIKFQAKLEEQAVSTSLQCRVGCNIETANAAQNNATKCLGFEFCDANGTTYQLSSGDGAARSVINTAVAFAGAHSVKFFYTPSTNVVGTIDATTVTKSTNLPNSGVCDADKTARFGIMTTNTVTKTLYIYGYRVIGVPNDNWV
jgi:hypothetical protein